MPTEQDIIAWYDKRYASRKREGMRPYEAYPVFLDYLGVEQGKRLLDIGCGTGYLLLAARRRGLDPYGIDISKEAVAVAKDVCPQVTISVGNGERLDFEDRFFDFVTCLGSLEHFRDLPKSLMEMRRVAKQEARFCIMVPNSDFIFWKILGRYGTEQQAVVEHLMKQEEWKDLFGRSGFRVLEVHEDVWPLNKPRKGLLGLLKRVVYPLLWGFLPLRYTDQFVFILEAGEDTSH